MESYQIDNYCMLFHSSICFVYVKQWQIYMKLLLFKYMNRHRLTLSQIHSLSFNCELSSWSDFCMKSRSFSYFHEFFVIKNNGTRKHFICMWISWREKCASDLQIMWKKMLAISKSSILVNHVVMGRVNSTWWTGILILESMIYPRSCIASVGMH